MKKVLTSLVILTVVLCAMNALAQMPNPYGPPISVDIAKKAAQVALDVARKNNWRMAVAVVDPNGTLVYYEKMDNTQISSAQVAIDKAKSAAIFKRSTKVLQDGLAAGGAGLRLLRLRDAIPIDGGYPILFEGKIIGAIGLSGDASENDAVCAKAAVASIK